MNATRTFAAIRMPVGIAFLAMACLLTPMQQSSAADDEQVLTAEKVLRLQQSGEIIPVQKVIEQVPLEITEVDLQEAEGKYEYLVLAVGDDGAKLQLTFDAATGEFLYGEAEDDAQGQNEDNSESEEN